MASVQPPGRSVPVARYDAFVASRLGQVERRIRFVDALTALLILAGFTVACAAVVVLVDRRLDLGAMPRAIILGGYLVVAGAYLVRALVLPSFRHINPYFAAQKVEQLVPGSKNSLVNWLDLKDRELPAAIRQNVVGRAVRDAGRAPVEQAARNRLLPWLASIVLVLLLATGIEVFVLGPGQFMSRVGRFLSPFGSGSVASSTRITILKPEGGNATVLMDDERPLQFLVQVEGRAPQRNRPDALKLLYRFRTDEPYQEQLLEREGDREWTTSLAPSQLHVGGLWYKITGGDGSTEEFRIEMRTRPLIEVLRASYRNRPYLRSLDHVEQNPTVLDGMRGTQVILETRANRKAASAELVIEIPKRKQVVAGKVDPANRESIVFQFVLDQDGSQHEQHGFWWINFISTDDEHSTNPHKYEMVVIRDEVPAVELTAPGQDVKLPANGMLRLQGNATDDHGIRDITLRLKMLDGQELQAKPYRPDKAFVFADHSYPQSLEYLDFLDLSQVKAASGAALTLRPGMKLEYWLEASDACDFPKPLKGQVGKSKTYRIEIAPPQTNNKKTEQQREKAKDEKEQHDQAQDQQLKKEEQQRERDKKEREQAAEQKGSGSRDEKGSKDKGSGSGSAKGSDDKRSGSSSEDRGSSEKGSGSSSSAKNSGDKGSGSSSNGKGSDNRGSASSQQGNGSGEKGSASGKQGNGSGDKGSGANSSGSGSQGAEQGSKGSTQPGNRGSGEPTSGGAGDKNDLDRIRKDIDNHGPGENKPGNQEQASDAKGEGAHEKPQAGASKGNSERSGQPDGVAGKDGGKQKDNSPHPGHGKDPGKGSGESKAAEARDRGNPSDATATAKKQPGEGREAGKPENPTPKGDGKDAGEGERKDQSAESKGSGTAPQDQFNRMASGKDGGSDQQHARAESRPEGADRGSNKGSGSGTSQQAAARKDDNTSSGSKDSAQAKGAGQGSGSDKTARADVKPKPEQGTAGANEPKEIKDLRKDLAGNDEKSRDEALEKLQKLSKDPSNPELQKSAERLQRQLDSATAKAKPEGEKSGSGAAGQQAEARGKPASPGDTSTAKADKGDGNASRAVAKGGKGSSGGSAGTSGGDGAQSLAKGRGKLDTKGAPIGVNPNGETPTARNGDDHENGSDTARPETADSRQQRAGELQLDVMKRRLKEILRDPNITEQDRNRYRKDLERLNTIANRRQREGHGEDDKPEGPRLDIGTDVSRSSQSAAPGGKSDASQIGQGRPPQHPVFGQNADNYLSELRKIQAQQEKK